MKASPSFGMLARMRILYGVVGEGMGHATRSRVVLAHLLANGHEVKVVVSGRAHAFLRERLQNHANLQIEEIEGLTLRYFDNRLDKSASLFENLKNSPKALAKNIEVYRRVAEHGFRPELVISDFESWAALYALNHFVPVISIDNMQIINRCRHDPEVIGARDWNYRLARLAVKSKIPGAYHYLITSFFYPPVRKKRTTLVPPIVRAEIASARREPQNHVLVYQTASQNDALLATLKTLPYEFRVYGLRRAAQEGNVTLREFSESGFVEDLRSARAVLSGGGFSLLSEAVSLGVPALSVPVEQQFEQQLNARYLQHLGYGEWAEHFTAPVIERFLQNVPRYESTLSALPKFDNSMLFACLDELLERRARGEKRPITLDSPALGKWSGATAAT
jgi:uncharacterized protein (TIGR00661 family)